MLEQSWRKIIVLKKKLYNLVWKNIKCVHYYTPEIINRNEMRQ